MQPLVEIIHISDLHFLAGRLPPRSALVKQMLEGTVWAPLVEHGWAGHDLAAPHHLLRWLEQHVTTRPWRGARWLVDTGDDTTFGDSRSMASADQLFDELRGFVDDAARIYGNHDVWPGEFPGLAAGGAFQEQRKRVNARYEAPWPNPPLVANFGNVEVQLTALDTVLDDRLQNAIAIGKGSEPAGSELVGQKLASLCNAVDDTPSHPTFRVLATHHPLTRQSLRPWDQAADRRRVLARLGGRFHLVLSGHTHRAFPAVGALPGRAIQCMHAPLGEQSVQLVAGSTLQQADDAPVVRDLRRGYGPDLRPVDWPRQLCVLRLYWDRNEKAVHVRRATVVHGPGSDEWRLQPLRRQGHAAEESVRILID